MVAQKEEEEKEKMEKKEKFEQEQKELSDKFNQIYEKSLGEKVVNWN